MMGLKVVEVLILEDQDPEFTGEALRRLVVDVEAAVGSHHAAMTPLGQAVMRLCENACDADKLLREIEEREKK